MVCSSPSSFSEVEEKGIKEVHSPVTTRALWQVQHPSPDTGSWILGLVPI
jgi:hypothetical protein